MKCPHCQEIIEDDSKFCNFCGKKTNSIYCINCDTEIKLPIKRNKLSDKYLCTNCRSKVPSFERRELRINDLEKRKQIEKTINQEMVKSKFSQKAISAINDYFKHQLDEDKIKIEESRKNQELEKQKEEEIKKDFFQKYQDHLITTGYNFEGYTIKKYLDVVSGECVLGTGIFSTVSSDFSDFFGTQSISYKNKLVEARKIAKQQAVFNSLKLGGNAIIGVDIDYINFTGDKIGVIFTGTSVTIEPTNKNDNNNNSKE